MAKLANSAFIAPDVQKFFENTQGMGKDTMLSVTAAYRSQQEGVLHEV